MDKSFNKKRRKNNINSEPRNEISTWLCYDQWKKIFREFKYELSLREEEKCLYCVEISLQCVKEKIK